MDAEELSALEKALRSMIAWRDSLAAELASMDREIAYASRALADASGVTVRPTLPQLRRQLADVDNRANVPLGAESAGAIPARPMKGI
jgi:hypothetical protein